MVQNDFTMHRLHTRNQHIPNNRLNLLDIALPAIASGIRRKTTNKVLYPIFKPTVHGNIRWQYYRIVLILILRISKPVSRFRQCIKMFFPYYGPLSVEKRAQYEYSISYQTLFLQQVFQFYAINAKLSKSYFR